MAEFTPTRIEWGLYELGEDRIVECNVSVRGVKQNAVAVENDETKVGTSRNGGLGAHGWWRARSTMVFQRVVRSAR
jgi:hypothetical protein